MRRLVCLTFLSLWLTGCDAVNTLTEGNKHSQETAGDLEKAVGVRPFVGFSWFNGALTSVSVNFGSVPAGKTNEEIAALARSSIRAHFKQSPQSIVVSFILPGEGPTNR